MASVLKTRLLMSFLDADDKRISLTVDEPRADLTEEEVVNTMDIIVGANIFLKDGLAIVAKADAKIVATDTTEFDLI